MPSISQSKSEVYNVHDGIYVRSLKSLEPILNLASILVNLDHPKLSWSCIVMKMIQKHVVKGIF